MAKEPPFVQTTAYTDAGAEPHKIAVETLAELTAGLDSEVLTLAVLHHVDGMTQEEIAAAVGLSRKTVGRKLQLFLQHTRAALPAKELV